jgi:predicted GNAT family acetyltransferase
MKRFAEFIAEMRSNEHLSVLLEPHGGQYGSPDEKIKHLSPTVTLHSKKEWGNYRFVKHDPSGRHISAVQVVSKGKGIGHVSNAYTHQDHRRQGHAAELVQHARKLFPKQLTFSDDLSDDGEGFVGGVK